MLLLTLHLLLLAVLGLLPCPLRAEAEVQQPSPERFILGFLGYQPTIAADAADQVSGVLETKTGVLRVAFEVACEHINRDPVFSERFQLECISRSLDNSVANTATACVSMVERGVIALIGPLRSEHSSACADALSRFEHFPILSPSSTRTQLDSRERYPGLLRTNPSEHCTVVAMVELLRALGVREAGVLCEKSMGQYASDFRVSAGAEGINVISGLCGEPTSRQLGRQLELLRASDRAVNLLALGPQTAENPMEIIKRSGMMGCPATWLLHDSSVLYNMVSSPCQGCHPPVPMDRFTGAA